MPYEFADEPKGFEFVDVAPATKATKFVKGLRDPIDGGAQLLTNVLPKSIVDAGNNMNNWLADKTGLVGRLPEGGVDQQVKEGERAYQESRKAAGESGFDGYRTLGLVASPASYAPAGLVSKGAGLTAKLAGGAASGAFGGLLTPVLGDDFLAEKGKQVGIGAVGGAAVPALLGGVSRVISPAASRNPDLALLRAEGVRPSIGQALGGAWNKAEEKLTSVPILGDAIAATRERAKEQFNAAAINRATAPIGVKAKGAGQEAVAEAGDAIKGAYTRAENMLGNFRVDNTGASQLSAVRSAAGALPPKEQATFNSVLSSITTDISGNGSLTAEGFKRIDSKLAAEAAKFDGSPDAYQKQLGEVFQNFRTALADSAKRANPKAAEAFKAADTAYANLVRVEGASKNAMNSGGVFTPGQLQSAVRQSDKSVRDRATARGGALMQDLSGAGQSVLGNKVPDSGTIGRGLLGAGLGAASVAEPMTLAGLLGSTALYAPGMRTLLPWMVSARPQAAHAVGNALQQAPAGLGLLGGQLGLGLLNQ